MRADSFIKKILPTAIVSAMILVASLFIPQKVTSYEQMRSVKLGYPFGFLIQDFSRYTPLEFPQKFRVGSPWEDPARVDWFNFVFSYASVFLILLAMRALSISALLRYFWGRRQTKMKL